MSAKAIFLVLVEALIYQTISSQCIGGHEGLGWEGRGSLRGAYGLTGPATPYLLEGVGYAPGTLAASNGGGFAVSSSSPIAPTGVFVTSENAYEGPVTVAGHVPFLGAIALEGELPTLGAGAVHYGCGDGAVAITNEGVPAPFNGVAGPYAYGEPYGFNGHAGHGYGGCGYGMY